MSSGKNASDTLVDSDVEDEDNDGPKRRLSKGSRRDRRKLLLEDNDADEEAADVQEQEDNDDEAETSSDVDKTFIAPYMKTTQDGVEVEEGDEEDHLEQEEEEDLDGNEGDEADDDDEEDIRIVGKKRRRAADPLREKRQRIQQYYCKGERFNSFLENPIQNISFLL